MTSVRRSASDHRPRAVRLGVGAIGAVLVALAVYLATAWLGDRGLAAGLAAGSLVLTLGALVSAARRPDAAPLARGRAALAALMVVALAAPLLLNAFVHLDYGRYIWVIAQPGLCAHLGSAAIVVSSAVVCWAAAGGACGVLVATRGPAAPIVPLAGAIVGGVLVLAGGLVALASPELGAALLGCRS